MTAPSQLQSTGQQVPTLSATMATMNQQQQHHILAHNQSNPSSAQPTLQYQALTAVEVTLSQTPQAIAPAPIALNAQAYQQAVQHHSPHMSQLIQPGVASSNMSCLPGQLQVIQQPMNPTYLQHLYTQGPLLMGSVVHQSGLQGPFQVIAAGKNMNPSPSLSLPHMLPSGAAKTAVFQQNQATSFPSNGYSTIPTTNNGTLVMLSSQAGLLPSQPSKPNEVIKCQSMGTTTLAGTAASAGATNARAHPAPVTTALSRAPAASTPALLAPGPPGPSVASSLILSPQQQHHVNSICGQQTPQHVQITPQQLFGSVQTFGQLPQGGWSAIPQAFLHNPIYIRPGNVGGATQALQVGGATQTLQVGGATQTLQVGAASANQEASMFIQAPLTQPAAQLSAIQPVQVALPSLSQQQQAHTQHSSYQQLQTSPPGGVAVPTAQTSSILQTQQQIQQQLEQLRFPVAMVTSSVMCTSAQQLGQQSSASKQPPTTMHSTQQALPVTHSGTSLSVSARPGASGGTGPATTQQRPLLLPNNCAAGPMLQLPATAIRHHPVAQATHRSARGGRVTMATMARAVCGDDHMMSGATGRAAAMRATGRVPKCLTTARQAATVTNSGSSCCPVTALSTNSTTAVSSRPSLTPELRTTTSALTTPLSVTSTSDHHQQVAANTTASACHVISAITAALSAGSGAGGASVPLCASAQLGSHTAVCGVFLHTGTATAAATVVSAALLQQATSLATPLSVSMCSQQHQLYNTSAPLPLSALCHVPQPSPAAARLHSPGSTVVYSAFSRVPDIGAPLTLPIPPATLSSALSSSRSAESGASFTPLTAVSVTDTLSQSHLSMSTIVASMPTISTSSSFSSSSVFTTCVTTSECRQQKVTVPQAMVKPSVLTHIVDGFIIQEASEPFPLDSNESRGEFDTSFGGKPDSPTSSADSKSIELKLQNGSVRQMNKTPTGVTTYTESFKRRTTPSADTVLCTQLPHSDTTRCADSKPSTPCPPTTQPLPVCPPIPAHSLSTMDAAVGVSGREVKKICLDTSAPIVDTQEQESPVDMDCTAASLPQDVATDSTYLSVNPDKPDPCTWTVDEVSEFIRNLPGCSDYAEDFQMQEIDGQALMLLRADHLMQAMSIRLGPALKICAKIDTMKRSSSLTVQPSPVIHSTV